MRKNVFDLGKIVSNVFLICIAIIVFIPMVTTFIIRSDVSMSEKRKLAVLPNVVCDGKLNDKYFSELEQWINDHIGFRNQMVELNGEMQYRLFGVLGNNTSMCLGPNGELNYVTGDILLDFQHLNLPSEAKLQRMANGYQKIYDYLAERDIQMYYYQCWDKHSIYPEHFPSEVKQDGDISKTDYYVKTLVENTEIPVISPKEILIEEKKNYETYGFWSDPTHWTQRGAYIGYCALMEEINKNSKINYSILDEGDYEIDVIDQGAYAFGGVHEADMLEDFVIKSPNAVEQNENLLSWGSNQRHVYYHNSSVSNDTKVLVIGDSYFRDYIIDDFAESFSDTIMVWSDTIPNFTSLIDDFQPDIVIFESAERCDNTGLMIRMAEAL